MTGSAETPFLLARVNELTGGASLASSMLYYHNMLIYKNEGFFIQYSAS